MRAGIIAAALVLSGCVYGPKYDPVEVLQMNYREAMQAFRAPVMTTKLPNGELLVQWAHNYTCEMCSRPSGSIERIAVVYDRFGEFVRIESRYRDSW